jgi:hypothetical protein
MSVALASDSKGGSKRRAAKSKEYTMFTQRFTKIAAAAVPAAAIGFGAFAAAGTASAAVFPSGPSRQASHQR